MRRSADAARPRSTDGGGPCVAKLGISDILGLGAIAAASPAARRRAEPEATPMQAPAAIRTLDDLVGLSAPQLDQLYRQSGPGPVPPARSGAGPSTPTPGSPGPAPTPPGSPGRARSSDPESSTAVNRFFGVRAVKGNVYAGPSWLDGGPSMILDYEGTSRIYGNYRDEIRQVAPGLYLGLMYDRTDRPAGVQDVLRLRCRATR